MESWLEVRKDNPHFEEVSDEHWREKSAKCLLHGATEIFEANELDKWLSIFFEPSRLTQRKASYLIGIWKKWMNEKGSWGHYYADDSNFVIKSKKSKTLINFIIRMAIEAEKNGKGHRSTLKKKFQINSKLGVIFLIRYCDNIDERERAQAAILNDYLSQGNPRPDYRLSIQDAGDTQKEGFLYSFSSN